MKKIKLFTLAFMFMTAVIFVQSFNVKAANNYNDTFLELNAKQVELAEKVEEIIKNDLYPSYFGGMYISDDSTHLVVQVVEDNIPATENSKEYLSFNQIKNMDGNIEYEYVKNSYKKLNNINDKLIEYFSSEEAYLENLSANYVDTFKNIVVVELVDNSAQQVDVFRERLLSNDSFKGLELTSDLIEYTQGKNENHAINAGEEITVNGTGLCSMGYRVTINGSKGYITAGHCFNGTGNSSAGGTVTRYQESGRVDAAFVKTDWWTNTFNAPSNNL